MKHQKRFSFLPLFKRLFSDVSGLSTTEYGVMLALGVVVAVPSIDAMMANTKTTIQNSKSTFTQDTDEWTWTPEMLPPSPLAPPSPEDKVLTGSSGSDTLMGGAGNDKLYGLEGDDYLQGSTGDDILIGGAGGDKIRGGEGNDTASYEDATTGVQTSLDTSLTCNSGKNGGMDDSCDDTYEDIENLSGSEFNDVLAGDMNDNIISGLGGDDILHGRDGNDTLNGGEGNDQLSGEQGNDVLYGENGNDQLDGGAGDDSLNGGDEYDVLIGGEGNNSLNGGDGFDIAIYNFNSGSINANLATGVVTRTGSTGGTDTLVNVEAVGGSEYNDDLTGDNGINALLGEGGNDTIHAGGGNDSINGGLGNDTLYGEDGNDSIEGGDGIDTLYGGDGDDSLNGGNGSDTLNGGNGTDSANYSLGGAVTINLNNTALSTGDAAGDTYVSIERYIGSYRANNSFVGDGGNNHFVGGTMNNTFNGGAGNDFFSTAYPDNASVTNTFTFDGSAAEGNDTISITMITNSSRILFSNPSLNSSNFSYSLSWSGNDRIITYAGGTITIKQANSSGYTYYQVPKMRFSNGSEVTINYSYP